jgi:hypothetical protein
MNLPAYYLDPIVFGDARVGAETIAAVAEDTRLGLGLPWISGLVISQGRKGLTGEILDLSINGKPLGSWTVEVEVEENLRRPDPAHKKRLKIDGTEILDILEKMDDIYGLSIEQKIWKVSASLLIQAQISHKIPSWTFPTPLGRLITVKAQKTK